MIDMNLDEVLKSLVKVEETFVRKLDFMFTGFFYELTEKAVMNTPFGNSDTNADKYEARSYTFFGRMLPTTEGTARNSWRFSAPVGAGDVRNANFLFTSPSSTYLGGWLAGDEQGSVSLGRVKTQISDFDVMKNGFVVIYNNAPYITKNKGYFPSGRDWSGATMGLEQGHSTQAPSGITKPTIADIQAIYKASGKFKSLFDQG
jgi:hypothetical protein